MPRVIGGKAGRLKLVTPSGQQTRPTADKTKETLFNILEARRHCEQLRVLDVFAGSGQLGIEALSRGASQAVFIERSRQACASIAQNLRFTRLAEAAVIKQGQALSVLRALVAQQAQFDLILIDPPYAEVSRFWQAGEPLLWELLAPRGYLILEQDKSQAAPELVTQLQRLKLSQCGPALLCFYMKP